MKSMAEDPARYLAGRIRQEHSITGAATVPQLLAACEQRGCAVFRSLHLRAPGYYVVTREGPLIVLRWDASSHVLAHELFHHLIHDNAQCGVIYCCPEWEAQDEQEAAHRFARHLCDPPDGARHPDPPISETAASLVA
jgi:Zn-dependent peptidase ImmA (M78 family)